MAELGKILVIDDEAQVASVLKKFLTRLGFTVLTADNGRQGLDRVEQDRPDLVFLDIKMPGMDGMDVLRRIRARFSDVEVIMITGARDAALASLSLAIGASDYITKPFDFDYLERVVLSRFPSPPSAPEEPVRETEPASAVEAPPEPDPGAELAQIASELSAPASAPAPAEAPTALSVEREPVAALAAECFRLSVDLTPMRVAREIQGCAVGLIDAVATGSDWRPRLELLGLYLQVVRRLGRLTSEDLARLTTLCQEVEAGS